MFHNLYVTVIHSELRSYEFELFFLIKCTDNANIKRFIYERQNKKMLQFFFRPLNFNEYFSFRYTRNLLYFITSEFNKIINIIF